MTETKTHPLKYWLDNIVTSRPTAAAIYIENEKIDYSTLKDHVDVLVSTLTQAGIKTGNHLALVTSSARILALMVYAAPYMGITFLPLDPRLPVKWQNSLFAQAGIEYVLCDIEISGNWGADMIFISLGQLLPQQFALVPIKIETPNTINATLMLATSGSTDIPKAVILSPENINASVHNTNKHLCFKENDLWLDCLPLFHIAGLMILYRSIACGAAVILHDRFDIEKIWHDLHAHPVTHLSLVPSMLIRLLKHARASSPPPTLKTVLIGGAPLDPGLAQIAIRLGWPLSVTYGMTETTSQVASSTLSLSENGSLPILTPIKLYDDIQIQIRDDNNQVCEGIGHITLRGPQIMSGYANGGEIGRHGLDQEGWLLTSDMGEVDCDRNLRIIGRADDVIITGGEKIHPAQVENLMNACPGIDEVSVIGKKDNAWGNILVAIHTGEFDEQQVERWCKAQFNGGWRPRLFKHMDTLPRLTNGKLDKKAMYFLFKRNSTQHGT